MPVHCLNGRSVLGKGTCIILSVYLLFGRIPSYESSYPQNSTDSDTILHFSTLDINLAAFNTLKTTSKFYRCSSIFLPITMHSCTLDTTLWGEKSCSTLWLTFEKKTLRPISIQTAFVKIRIHHVRSLLQFLVYFAGAEGY